MKEAVLVQKPVIYAMFEAGVAKLPVTNLLHTPVACLWGMPSLFQGPKG
jgi:hypothetical protein